MRRRDFIAGLGGAVAAKQTSQSSGVMPANDPQRTSGLINKYVVDAVAPRFARLPFEAA